jgi:hypothetical protein
MLIFMGAIGEAATGYVIAGRPELTVELADRLVDTMLDGWCVPPHTQPASNASRI